jgi:hypothetical protein
MHDFLINPGTQITKAKPTRKQITNIIEILMMADNTTTQDEILSKIR